MCVCVAEAIESMTIGWLIGRERIKEPILVVKATA